MEKKSQSRGNYPNWGLGAPARQGGGTLGNHTMNYEPPGPPGPPGKPEPLFSVIWAVTASVGTV